MQSDLVPWGKVSQFTAHLKDIKCVFTLEKKKRYSIEFQKWDKRALMSSDSSNNSLERFVFNIGLSVHNYLCGKGHC